MAGGDQCLGHVPPTVLDHKSERSNLLFPVRALTCLFVYFVVIDFISHSLWLGVYILLTQAYDRVYDRILIPVRAPALVQLRRWIASPSCFQTRTGRRVFFEFFRLIAHHRLTRLLLGKFNAKQIYEFHYQVCHISEKSVCGKSTSTSS